MDLELATTRDILEELRHRDMRFAFVGLPGRNGPAEEIYFACQGCSERDLVVLLRLMQHHLAHGEGQG